MTKKRSGAASPPPGAAAGGKAVVGNGRPGRSGHPYLNSEVDARGHGGRRVELDYGNFVVQSNLRVLIFRRRCIYCFYCVAWPIYPRELRIGTAADRPVWPRAAKRRASRPTPRPSGPGSTGRSKQPDAIGGCSRRSTRARRARVVGTAVAPAGSRHMAQLDIRGGQGVRGV